MKLGQNFVKYFVRFLGNGVSKKNAFEIYWSLEYYVYLCLIIMNFILITAAVKKGSPVTVTMIRSTGIVFSFLLQTQNDEGLPSILSIFGAMVISGAVFLMTFETRINEKLESSKCCRRHQQSEDQQSNIIQSPCSSILKQSIAWSFHFFLNLKNAFSA